MLCSCLFCSSPRCFKSTDIGSRTYKAYDTAVNPHAVQLSQVIGFTITAINLQVVQLGHNETISNAVACLVIWSSSTVTFLKRDCLNERNIRIPTKGFCGS